MSPIACPQGTYRNATGGTEASGCSSCLLDIPNSNTNNTGETSIDACVCAEGYYNLHKELRQCELCTDGMLLGEQNYESRT